MSGSYPEGALRRVAFVLAVFLMTLPLLGWAEEAEWESRGERLFDLHCASCHGHEGRGDGVVAEALREPPADLTRLALRGKGWQEEARAVLVGEKRVGTHGPQEMPVWGLSFVERGRVADQQREVEAEIDALISFLSSIQRPPS